MTRSLFFLAFLAASLVADRAAAQCPGPPPPPGISTDTPQSGMKPDFGPVDDAPATTGARPTRPSTPSTPNAPSAPGAPNRPATPALPATPAGTAGAPAMTGGEQLPTAHGPSARTLLTVAWTYPVLLADAVDGRRTYARQAPRALPRDEAFRRLAGDDPRPLLVLRECAYCLGSERALLRGGEDDTKTFLLSQWFHCVRLPKEVLRSDHPFHEVFGTPAPHLLLASPDGTEVVAMPGDLSRVQLWKAMETMLAQHYDGPLQQRLRGLNRLVGKYDAVDEEIRALLHQQELAAEKYGPRSAKAKRLARRLAKARAEREELDRQRDELLDLPLRTPAARNP